MSRSPEFVTACIPTFKCTKYLRQSVISLLSQTYPYLRIIVINDGDPEPPWHSLADISDPRLIRFDLSENRGPYFALAVALEATPDRLLLVQDADDWSAPHRVATLMQIMRRDASQYAFSTQAQFSDHPSGGIIFHEPMFPTGPDTTVRSRLKYRMPHQGLFRTEALRRLGGYYGGFKFNYDTLLTSLFLLAGRVSWSSDHLYWRRLRPTSLFHAPDTGWRSLARQQMHAEMAEFYRHAYRDYQNFVMRRVSGPQFLRLIQWRVGYRRGAIADQQIKHYAAYLRNALGRQAGLLQ